MKKYIPNFLTCLNLFSGCIATVMIFHNRLEWAAYLVFAAAIFDFLDGMAARILDVHSPMGKELDSLADVITFGFVPGAIMFSLLQMSDLSLMYVTGDFKRVFQFFPFVITMFSALRLAKFNIDTRQSESFIGLPTPANTLIIVSFPLILLHDDAYHLRNLILNPYFIVITCILLSYLLVAELPLFALKFKSFSWKDNKYQYILLASSVVLIGIFYFVAIPVIVLLYIFLSLIRNVSNINRKKRNPQTII